MAIINTALAHLVVVVLIDIVASLVLSVVFRALTHRVRIDDNDPLLTLCRRATLMLQKV